MKNFKFQQEIHLSTMGQLSLTAVVSNWVLQIFLEACPSSIGSFWFFWAIISVLMILVVLKLVKSIFNSSIVSGFAFQFSRWPSSVVDQFSGGCFYLEINFTRKLPKLTWLLMSAKILKSFSSSLRSLRPLAWWLEIFSSILFIIPATSSVF